MCAIRKYKLGGFHVLKLTMYMIAYAFYRFIQSMVLCEI